MKNKKATSVLAWIAVTFVICFVLLVLYLAPVAYLVGKKIIFEKGEVEIERIENDLVLLESFFNFLDEENNGVLIKDLVKGEPSENEENFLRFKQLSFEFLKNRNLNGWMRIYGFDEEISKYSSGKYKQYGSSLDFFISPDRTTSLEQENDVCNPDDENNNLFYVINENKKIVMCVKNELHSG